jgi:hypothetical protein
MSRAALRNGMSPAMSLGSSGVRSAPKLLVLVVLCGGFEMNQGSQVTGGTRFNSTSKMSFAVAACAFAAAGLGLLVNQWMSGWMAVGGMAGIGLFYSGVGLLNLRMSNFVYTDEIDLIKNASAALSEKVNVEQLQLQEIH